MYLSPGTSGTAWQLGSLDQLICQLREQLLVG